MIDFKSNTQELSSKFKPYGYSGWDSTHNLEGYIVYPGSPGLSYSQFFRNGACEFCTSVLFSSLNGKDVLEGTQLEFFVVETVKSYIDYSIKMQIEPPFIVCLSIIGADCRISGLQAQHQLHVQYPISGLLETKELLLPEILIDSSDQDLPSSLRIIFDIIWQAAGKSGSPHFKENGSWGLSLEKD